MAQVVSLVRRGVRLGAGFFIPLILWPAFLPAQTLRFQPYLSLDWDPAAYDTAGGRSSDFEYRALNIDQAGLKITFTADKISLYFENRGFPSGAKNYNTYDGYSVDQAASYEKIVYYAWGKYQFTPSGTLWAGKLKPAFGPILIDSSHFGVGWLERAGAHTIGAFVFQPGANLKRFIPKGSGWASPGPSDDTGIRFLLMDEYRSPHLYATFGGAYTLFEPTQNATAPWVNTNKVTQLHFDAFVSYSGLPKWIFTGEGAVAVYVQEDGIATGSGNHHDSGVGFALFASAEYQADKRLSLGASFELDDVLVGAAENTPANGERRAAYDYGTAKGQINLAELALYAAIAPGKGFSVQPRLGIQLANAFNNNDPPEGGKVGCTVQLRFRWEPTFDVKL
ncbi:MAG: hypothetical protein LBS64_02350 [Spirochaetaceae bacterium]|jgi:hypothetical protein|nr:hypothetical protein [Spirochaetaceae bacterium]